MTLKDKDTAPAAPDDASRGNDRLGFWREMGVYEKFETVVSIGLVLVASAIALLAFVTLLEEFWRVLAGERQHAAYASLQPLFGLVLTVVISLEFSRSLIESLGNRHFVITSQSVILIAILTVVRKLMLININEVSGATLAALAFVILALGVLYWVLVNTRLAPRVGE